MGQLAIVMLATSLVITHSGLSSEPPAQPAPEAAVEEPTDPKLVSDRVAYSLLFRVLSAPRDEAGKELLKKYVDRIGLESEADESALQAVAAEFGTRIAELDAQVDAIKKKENDSKSQRSAQDQATLLRMRTQYDLIVDECIGSLATRLSSEGLATLRNFMDSDFKQKVQLRPAGPARKKVDTTAIPSKQT